MTWSAQPLAEVARAVARADPGRGERIARTVTSPRWQVMALAAVARAEPGRAVRLADEMTRIADAINDPIHKAQAMTAVVEAVADVDAAEAIRLTEEISRIAGTITEPHARADALTYIAQAMARADPGRSIQLAEQVVQLAEWITGNQRRTQAVTAVVTAVTGADPARAAKLASKTLEYVNDEREIRKLILAVLTARSDPVLAAQIAWEIADRTLRRNVLLLIALVVARTDPDRAVRMANTIVKDRSVDSAEVRTAVALTLAENYPEHALEIATEISDSKERAPLLTAVAQALASTDPDQAEQLAGKIDSSAGEQALLLATIAQASAPTDSGRAARLSMRAVQIAASDADFYSEQVGAIVLGTIAHTDPDRAERMVNKIGEFRLRASAMKEIARAVARTKPDQALRMAAAIDEPKMQAQALIGIAYQAGNLGQTGRLVAAHAVADLLRGDHWPDAFGLLAFLEPETARAGCEAFLNEPIFDALDVASSQPGIWKARGWPVPGL